MKKTYLAQMGVAAGGVLLLSVFSLKANSTLPSPQAAIALAETAALAPEPVNLAEIEVENVLFDFDRSTIRPESYGELDRLAKLLMDNNGSLKLGGHADNIGEYVYNWHLSKARADAVKAYLVAKGADESRIAATEFGDTTPIATNDTEQGRQQNRRVEVELY
jgi:OOP family OmpA-OmpF porin